MKNKIQSIAEKIFKESESTKSCGCSKAVIVCEGKTSVYSDRMLIDDDPTAHAAIVLTRSMRGMIRKNQDLKLLLSEKPCPMCISAIYQTNIKDLHYLDHNNEIKKIELNSNNIHLWYEEIYTNQEK